MRFSFLSTGRWSDNWLRFCLILALALMLAPPASDLTLTLHPGRVQASPQNERGTAEKYLRAGPCAPKPQAWACPKNCLLTVGDRVTYATKQDIIDLYGDDALFMADRNNDAITDDAPVSAALVSATNEINGYVGARYDLPLAVNPPQLIQPCVDIAIYRLAKDAASRSEEDRQRYEDAVELLTKVSKGVIELALPTNPETGEDFDTPTPIVASGPPRIFSRDKTRGL